MRGALFLAALALLVSDAQAETRPVYVGSIEASGRSPGSHRATLAVPRPNGAVTSPSSLCSDGQTKSRSSAAALAYAAVEMVAALVDQAIDHLRSHGEEAELLRAIARFAVARDH